LLFAYRPAIRFFGDFFVRPGVFPRMNNRRTADLRFTKPQADERIVSLGRYAPFFQCADNRAARGLPRAGVRRDEPILIAE
jgi:hypothetical protein